ncbi:MAG: hypothetical protein SH857_12955 [Chitinophagales bacterium]|nr:hypothetical protein [Chitinophagales bacterium]
MIKNIIYALSLSIILSSCHRETANVISDATYLTYANGVLKVRATGYGNQENEAITAAEKAALEALMFRGIPGSQQNMPLVSIDEKSKSDNQKYFNEFFDGLRYKSFIVSSQAVSPLTKVSGGKVKENGEKQPLGKNKITVDIGINLASLRKNLEQNNVIRKFGLD